MEFNDNFTECEGIVCKGSLSKKFWKGLEEKHGLTYEDIIEQGWTNAGGVSNRNDRHMRYFLMITQGTNLQPPPHLDYCVCDHDIVYNYYIIDRARTKLIVIGSCCINLFMPENRRGRTCDECEKPHRNRKVNKCNDCKSISKKKRCDICEKPHRNRKVNKCNDCKDKCSRCKTDITGRFGYEKYERCRNCEYIKECIKCKKSIRIELINATIVVTDLNVVCVLNVVKM